MVRTFGLDGTTKPVMQRASCFLTLALATVAGFIVFYLVSFIVIVVSAVPSDPIVAVAALVLVLLAFAQYPFRTLRSLGDAAVAIPGGTVGLPAIESDVDIGFIARGFNELAERIADRDRELAALDDERRSLLAAALDAIGGAGSLIREHMNSAADAEPGSEARERSVASAIAACSREREVLESLGGRGRVRGVGEAGRGAELRSDASIESRPADPRVPRMKFGRRVHDRMSAMVFGALLLLSVVFSLSGAGIAQVAVCLLSSGAIALCLRSVIRRTLTTPLDHICDVITRVRAADSTVRAAPSGGYELRAVGTALNTRLDLLGDRSAKCAAADEKVRALTRALLAELRGPAETMAEQLERCAVAVRARNEDTFERSLAETRRALRRERSLVEDLVLLSKLEHPETKARKVPTWLYELIDRAQELLPQALNRKVTFEQPPAQGSPLVLCDEMLAMAVALLIESMAGSAVTVEVYVDSLVREHAEIVIAGRRPSEAGSAAAASNAFGEADPFRIAIAERILALHEARFTAEGSATKSLVRVVLPIEIRDGPEEDAE